jgi:hypothetical protein
MERAGRRVFAAPRSGHADNAFAAASPPRTRSACDIVGERQEGVQSYLTSPPHKAFALAPDGHFGWQSGVGTTDAAKTEALQYCRQGAPHCDLMFVDDAPVYKDSPRGN